jgi:hypothetical protein
MEVFSQSDSPQSQKLSADVIQTFLGSIPRHPFIKNFHFEMISGLLQAFQQ